MIVELALYMRNNFKHRLFMCNPENTERFINYEL